MNYQFGNRLRTQSVERLHTSPSRNSDQPRFQRNSPQSNRTSPSRSSEESPVCQKFIKFNKISKLQLDPDEFFQGFSSEFVRKEEEEQANSIKKLERSRQNSTVRVKTLQKELDKRQYQLEQTKNQNNRLKIALDKQIQKRRQVEKNLKANTIILSQLQRKNRENELTISNLQKEVRYLQEKKYTKSQKLQFSFREKGLMDQINRLKAVQFAQNNLQFLQRQNRRLQIQNEQIRAENNYLRIGQRTIIHKLLHFQKQLKVAIKLEEQFFDLRYKYEQLAKKERRQRKQLEQLKHLMHIEDKSKAETLSYSSSSASSIPIKNLVRTNKYHHHSRKPNGS